MIDGRRVRGVLLFCGLVAGVFLPPLAGAEPGSRVEFTRMIAHWDAYGERDLYLKFVDAAAPEVTQVGFYGGHFWSLAHTPQYKGYPAHFPLQGLDECGTWFEELNQELHERNAKVVGHFNVKFLVGDPESDEGPRGFFKFYRDLWDEKELGPRPVADPRDLLERKADGSLLTNNSYSIGGMKEYWGCLNNPHWRAVLKAWTKRGIERGVDGYIANYFYRHDCHCEHCQREFRSYLADRFTPAELKQQFDIGDLASHRFTEIVSWHKPEESTPLRREMLRFSQVANKRAFDEVFIEYGRSLKPDLIVAQWNHLGDFSQINGDERCLLPTSLWGRGEDYLWYSTGGSACFTDLAEGFLGDGTLRARYIRGSFDDKPFTLGKYEGTRIRSAIAELAANGGAPMGFYTRFKDPEAFTVIARYYQFLKRYDDIYHANRPYGEGVLLFPRTRVHSGDVATVEKFKEVGRKLLDQHVLFDVYPDDLVSAETLGRYQKNFSEAAGDADLSLPAEFSRFEAPQTVRISASRPATGTRLHLHFVNYNREEPEQKRSPGRGIADEKPIAAPEIRCDLVLPAGAKTARVTVMSPEEPEPHECPVTIAEGRARFSIPAFLVYTVAQVEWDASK